MVKTMGKQVLSFFTGGCLSGTIAEQFEEVDSLIPAFCVLSQNFCLAKDHQEFLLYFLIEVA